MTTLQSIVATFQCEGCGKCFDVEVPIDFNTRSFDSVYEIAVANLEAGRASWRDNECSHIAGVVLCGRCTGKIDKRREAQNKYRDQCERDWILRELGAT